jgi:hypothetical protein
MISRPDWSIRNLEFEVESIKAEGPPLFISRLLRIDAELAENAIKIVAPIVFDRDGPTFVSMMDDNASRQAVRQEILYPLDGGRKAGIIRGGAPRGRLAGAGELLGGELLRHPHGRALADDEVHQKSLLFMGFEGKEHLGVAHGNPTLLEKRLGVRLQIQKPHGIGYRGAALADTLGDLILRQAEITVEPCVGPRLFDGIQVFALEVFNQREFEHLSVARLADDGGGLRDPKFTRGAPPSLSRNDLVLVVDPANDERLDDAALANAFDKLLQVLASKFLPWLKRAGRYLVKRQRLNALAEFLKGCGSGNASVNQRAESFAKCGFCHGRKMGLGRMAGIY